MVRGIPAIILVLIVGLLMYVGCKEEAGIKEEQRAIDQIEEQVKWGIWKIYEALWEYKLDHGGYPEMIYGGDKEGWDFYNSHLTEGKSSIKDPLIEGGYLKEYPYNPFIRIEPKYVKAGLVAYRKGIEEFQHTLAIGSFDPRFGAGGDRMGNAFLAPFIFVGPGMKDKPKHLRLCPGQFLYRTYGKYSVPDNKHPSIERSPLNYKPAKCGAYVIGAFGALDTEGGDVIRWTDMNGYVPPEYPYTYEDQFYIPHLDTDVYVHLRLPELFGGGRPSVLPTWPPWTKEGRIITGAPDGFRDGAFYVVDWTGTVVVDKKVKKKKR